jgi:hypothetical protein
MSQPDSSRRSAFSDLEPPPETDDLAQARESERYALFAIACGICGFAAPVLALCCAPAAIAVSLLALFVGVNGLYRAATPTAR